MKRLRNLIATLLLVVCSAYHSVAYAGATDPTPSQIVSAIKRAHIEGIAAGNPGLASHFVVYPGGKAYGPDPGDPGDHFYLSVDRYLTVNGQHLVLFQYFEGPDAWKEFAFFVDSLNYAGELPGGRNVEYQSVGQNLVVRQHILQGADGLCCPTGPWRTLATLSANSHGLVTTALTSTPTAQTESGGTASPTHPTVAAVPAPAATTPEKAAVAALVSLERSRGNTDVEKPSCFVVQTYAQCQYEVGGGDASEWALLYLKNGEWTFLGGGGEVTYDHGVEQFGSFAAMLEKQYGISAAVAQKFAAKMLHP